MADSTLAAIRTKVRRLTRSPSSSQITDTQIDEYVNTFILYDIPEHLRLFTLRTNLTFFTEPFIDTYETELVDTTHPLYNFKNRYITINPPMYIAGYQVAVSQSQNEFYGNYPKVESILTIGQQGDGVTTNFTGTLSQIPILRGQVLFSSITAANAGLALYDDGAGALTGDGTGTINYITGAFNITFSTAPGSGEAINSQTYPYVAARPYMVLYFDNKFVMRPIPDMPYRVEVEAYIRPTELLAASESPELEQWWQYIAYGASKKIFEDRMDVDSVQLIFPEYEKQERLVLRRTIVQQMNERSATIFTENRGNGYGPGWFNGGGFF